MNYNVIPITGNGTTQIYQTIASIGYQFVAFANGSAGAWNGANIAIQIFPNNVSQPITIATLTELDPFIEKIQIVQGMFIQIVVTGANVGTSLNLIIAPLGVYNN